jgi:hypothetical protein
MASFLFRRSLAAGPATISHPVLVKVSARHSSSSAMYGISALSNRHETQHFHRLSRLPLMEHSPTLKLLYTSEVAPGASSATFSSLPIDSSEHLEEKPRRQAKQESGAPERTKSKPTHGLGDATQQKVSPATSADHWEEIQRLKGRLDWHTTKLAELQQAVEKWTGASGSQSKSSPGAGRPADGKEDDAGWLSLLSDIAMWAFAGAAGYYMGKAHAASEAAEQQNAALRAKPNNVEPLPADGCEYLTGENNVQVRFTVERIVDGVLAKNPVEDASRSTTRQADATESNEQLVAPKTPTSSWTSLLWKKQ